MRSFILLLGVNALWLTFTGMAAQPGTAAPLPIPVTPRSPVQFFRELLALTPAQREQALTNRSPAARAYIQVRLEEYARLTQPERDVRLHQLELYWYLKPLLAQAPSNRVERLATISPDLRQEVVERLEFWDQRPVEMQRAFLTNEAVITQMVGSRSSAIASRTNISFADTNRWQALTERERMDLTTAFKKIFELSNNEKARVLRILPVAPRQQAKRTIAVIDQLPPTQRDLCAESLTKWASLNLDQRREFLKSCERWKEMPPAQKQAWRDLTRRYNPPPLPIGYTTAPARTN